VKLVGQITPHFSWSEFACHDQARTPVPEHLRENARLLAIELERVRAACFGQPLTVTRAYSTPEHNATIPGAAPRSYHLRCLAADILPPAGLTSQQLYDTVRRLPALYQDSRIRFVRWYKTTGHVHLDLRPGKRVVAESVE
jgi:uncharacterized protein YcbK (DUF882 family)